MEWINVKDKLPEDGLLGKLVCDSLGQISIASEISSITHEDGRIIFLNLSLEMFLECCDALDVRPADLDDFTHITHWMPLPEPPKESADG